MFFLVLFVGGARDRMVVIADATKRVARLGAFPLPVEIVRFGWTSTRRAVSSLLNGMDVDGHGISIRTGSTGPLVTDEGHYILDLHLGRIGDAPALAAGLNAIPGVVESGLFIDLAAAVIVGNEDGTTEVLERPVAPGTPLDQIELMRNLDA